MLVETEREDTISSAEELLEELKSAKTNSIKEFRHAMYSFIALFTVELKHFHKEEKEE